MSISILTQLSTQVAIQLLYESRSGGDDLAHHGSRYAIAYVASHFSADGNVAYSTDQAEGRFYHKLKDHLERHLGTLAVVSQYTDVSNLC